MSEFGGSVLEKKRIIFKNPDGSYTHCKLSNLTLNKY